MVGIAGAVAPDSRAPPELEEASGEVSELAITVYFVANGMNLADLRLPASTTVRKLASTVAMASLRARKAAFPTAPRLTFLGEDLPHGRTLEEAGLGDGAELLADAYPTVVTASSDGSARVWNAETGECEKVLEGHTGPLLSAGFSPDAKLVATSSEDKTAKLWSSVSGECWCTLRGHRDAVNCCAFSPDGKWVVTASNDTLGKVWSSKNGRCLATLEGHGQPVFSASFSPDGVTVITNSQEGKAIIWDSKSGTFLRSVHDNCISVYTTSFAPDGKTMAFAPGDKTAQICDTDSGRCERILKGHAAIVIVASYAPASCELIYPSTSSPRTSRSPSPSSRGSPMGRTRSVCSMGMSRNEMSSSPVSRSPTDKLPASPGGSLETSPTNATAFMQTHSAA